MKKQGKRLITSPSLLAYNSNDPNHKDMPKGDKVVFNVELLDIKPLLPDHKDNLFHISLLKRGAGRPIFCGAPARVHVTVWDTAGTKVFSTHDGDDKPLNFTTGESQVFLGLEQGCYRYEGKRKTRSGGPSRFPENTTW